MDEPKKANDLTRVEYKIRPITRYVVTRYHEIENGAGCETKGEYDNPDIAFEVGYALCKAEHERLGFFPGDERIQYPSHPTPGSMAPVAPVIPALSNSK